MWFASAAAKPLKFTMIMASTASKMPPIFAQLASQMAKLLRNLMLQFAQDSDKLATDDAKKDDELFRRTPGYESWQGEHWVACCDDYCAFLGDVGTKELKEFSIADEVFDDYAKRDEYDVKMAREMLVAGGNFAGYLFRCLHCKKYHIYIDAC